MQNEKRGLRQEAKRKDRIAPRGTRNGDDRAKSHEERIRSCQEARGTDTITPRGTRNGDDCAKRHEERRPSRQEAQGTESIASRGARKGEYRAKRRKEQERERGAKKNGNVKVPCRNKQEWQGTSELAGTWRKGAGVNGNSAATNRDKRISSSLNFGYKIVDAREEEMGSNEQERRGTTRDHCAEQEQRSTEQERRHDTGTTTERWDVSDTSSCISSGFAIAFSRISSISQFFNKV